MKRNALSLLLLVLVAISAVAQAPVVNPPIPNKIEFAGQTFDLSDPDKRERVDRELTSMAFTHGNTLLQIKRANKYFPLIAPILKNQGVPLDLLYLACIESTMNPRAVSPAKAAGLWQFMPSTGRDYGLEVNEYVDERYDPEKATVAACKYLKSGLGRYNGDWASVAASYNAGMGRVSNELKAQQQQSAFDLWLAEETMRYIPRLLAAKLIMENPKAYGFILTEDQLYHPRKYREIEVSEPVADWAVWAVEHGSNYYRLREHNPWIRSKSLPNKNGKTYIVRLPDENKVEKTVYNKAWVTKN